MSWSHRVVWVAIGMCLAWSGSIRADHGRIEINQARALAGGVTPGDASGFPVTLSAPGSYLLTGDLEVGDPDLGAIVISSSNVTLDLGGFALQGARVCTGEGSAMSCSLARTGGAGVQGGADGTVVRNGVIRGFAAGLAIVGRGCIVERVTATRNSGHGIIVATSCIILESIAERNWHDGITPGPFNVLMRSRSVGNRVRGVDMGGIGSVAVANTARLNGSEGFLANNGSVVSANTAGLNELDGINLGGCSVALGNALADNAQLQLRMPFTLQAWANNVLKTDPAVATSGTFFGGTQMGPNLCDGVLCP